MPSQKSEIIYARWLAEALHGGKSKHRYLLMLKAYMDESGHSLDAKCRFVGMGGLCAPSEGWDRFDIMWEAALDEFIGGAPFHMKEFTQYPGIGPYKGWEEFQRREFLSRLVSAIRASGCRYIGSVVSVDGFNALHPPHQQIFKDPYFIAFQDVTYGCSICGMSEHGPDVGEKVAMVYAYQQAFGAINSGSSDPEQQGRAERLWHAMKANPDVVTQWMGAYGSELAKNVYALQAADLFAYEITKEFENRLKRPKDAMRWALREMLKDEHRQALIKFVSRDSLLERLMDWGFIEDDIDIRLSSVTIQLDRKMDMVGRWSK